jgi:hypothetical protein
MSAAAKEALAKPIGLRGRAVVAASGLRECCRSGGDVVCACCQWSSGYPRQGTLVRHFMCGVLASRARDVDAVTLDRSQRGALTPALGSCSVPHAATARALVTTGGLAPCRIVRLAPAGASAMPVAAIAAAAQDDLDAAPDAQEQTGWTVQLHHQTEPVVLDGLVPASHTAAAPPSSARCRARRGHQAARRERTAAAPTFFGLGRVVLRRLGPGLTDSHYGARTPVAPVVMPITAVTAMASRPALSLRSARSPCRATGQTHHTSIKCSARNSSSRCRMRTQNRIRLLAIT